jgi:hypothetical protein
MLATVTLDLEAPGEHGGLEVWQPTSPQREVERLRWTSPRPSTNQPPRDHDAIWICRSLR